MGRQILYMHWKAVRLGMLPLVIASFGLPLMLIQGLARPEGLTDGFWASQILSQMSVSQVVMLPLLAGVTGVTLALTTWSWDHQGKHVHALSLPIPRWRYTALKFGAGALLALLPTLALLTGGLTATAALDLPPLLHAYPGAVTVRFLLSTLLVFGILFAFAAGSIRTTVILLTVWILVLITGNRVVDFGASMLNRRDLATFDVVDWMVELLTRQGGPFHILTGNWALIDV